MAEGRRNTSVGATAKAPALSMVAVRKRYGATVALDGVELAVREGEVHALLGENGAGKSTLMKVLAGVVAPDAGTMSLFGSTYAPRGPHAARRAGVAMIHQELALAPHLTVAENILLGDEPRRLGLVRRARMRAGARAALAEIGRADIDVDLRAGALGVAEQQLVEIARAIAVGCRVLILDEPTSSLARPDVQRLFALVRRLRGAGCAIVYISHFLEEVQEIADVFTVLRDGRTVGGGAVPATSPKAMASLMVGRTIDELFPRSPRTPGEVVVEIDRLSGRVLPREATLSLRRGEVVGIAGLVGAGRTELLRALFGLDVVRAGRVRVATFSSHRAARRAAGGAFVATASATDVPAALGGSTSATPRSRWRGGMGFVPEDRKRDGLMLGRSIAENIAITRLRAIASPRSIAAASRPWIERLGIRCAGPDQRVAALSGGNQQKVVMARLLRHGCDILLLDEPTRGVDVGAKATIHRIVDEAATGADGRPPCAVLLASSSLPELLGVCDRIAVMCRGSLGPARRVAEWDEHRLMRAATGVADAGDGAESAGRGAHEGGRS